MLSRRQLREDVLEVEKLAFLDACRRNSVFGKRLRICIQSFWKMDYLGKNKKKIYQGMNIETLISEAAFWEFLALITILVYF